MSNPKKPLNPSRRRFGQQLAQSTAALTAAFGTGLKAREARAAAAAEPHFLINIHTRGGEDSAWWRNYIQLPTSCDSSTLYCPNGATATSTNPQAYFMERFQGTPVTFADGTQLGIGMSILKNNFSNFSIVRGMQAIASHDIGNRIVNCGQFTNYAASFSSLIAAGLPGTPLPLQYVQVAAAGTDLYEWPGMLSGNAIGVNIPDLPSLIGLSSTFQNDLNASRRAMVSSAVNTLASQLNSSGFKLSSTQAYYSNFMTYYNGISRIYGSGMGLSHNAQGTGLLDILSAYMQQVFQDLMTLSTTYSTSAYTFNPALASGCPWALSGNSTLASFITAASQVASNALAKNVPTSNPSPYPGEGHFFTPADTALTTLGATGQTFGPASYISPVALWYTVCSAAYGFALAEYLITNGLTRVIDVGPISCFIDAHAGNPAEAQLVAIKYSLFNTLMSRLSSIQYASGGKSYLDLTTIVMSTEFDRAMFLSSNPGLGNEPIGTNHGSSVSFMVAGKGVNKGRVFGNVGNTVATYGQALYIDPASGKQTDTGSVFPTIMAMFGADGVSTPGQQITTSPTVSEIVSGS